MALSVRICTGVVVDHYTIVVPGDAVALAGVVTADLTLSRPVPNHDTVISGGNRIAGFSRPIQLPTTRFSSVPTSQIATPA